MYRDRSRNADEIVVSLREGLGFRAALDGGAAGMLGALDGEQTLGAVAAELARLEAVGPAAVEEALLPLARGLLAAGFLVRRT